MSQLKDIFSINQTHILSLDAVWPTTYELPIPPELSFAWWSGSGSGITSVERTDFTSDTTTPSLRGPLAATVDRGASTGNSVHSWGSRGAPSSAIQRITHSTDTSAASLRSTLTIPRYMGGATGNKNYGWWASGYSGITYSASTGIDRLDYSSDTSAALRRGTFPDETMRGSATGTSSFGWVSAYGSTGRSSVYRIDYGNDNTTASTRGPLSAARYRLDSTTNSVHGWWIGGFTPQVDRITFASDTGTASNRGNVGIYMYGLAGSGDNNYGWYSGGFNAASFTSVGIFRIDYSNDTAGMNNRSSLSATRYHHNGNSTYIGN